MGCGENECSTENHGHAHGCGDMLGMWHIAAEQAMIEVKKDAIKAVLQEKFGDGIKQSAEAVVKAIGTKIKAGMAEEEAIDTLKKELGEIMSKNMENCEC